MTSEADARKEGVKKDHGIPVDSPGVTGCFLIKLLSSLLCTTPLVDVCDLYSSLFPSDIMSPSCPILLCYLVYVGEKGKCNLQEEQNRKILILIGWFRNGQGRMGSFSDTWWNKLFIKYDSSFTLMCAEKSSYPLFSEFDEHILLFHRNDPKQIHNEYISQR